MHFNNQRNFWPIFGPLQMAQNFLKYSITKFSKLVQKKKKKFNHLNLINLIYPINIFIS